MSAAPETGEGLHPTRTHQRPDRSAGSLLPMGGQRALHSPVSPSPTRAVLGESQSRANEPVLSTPGHTGPTRPCILPGPHHLSSAVSWDPG